MARGRFDEKCPHCEKKIADLDGSYETADYASDYELKCMHCGKSIEIFVHKVIEFELCKPGELDAQI